jgi:outer membrane protein, multidrug efflux system
MMTLSGNIARTWFSIIAQQLKLELLHRQLEANTRVLELLQLRQRNAISTALDVLQQRQIVESTRALVPDAELQLGLYTSQLNVLLGRPSGTAIPIETPTPPDMPPLPATGFPADLLAKRPDIQAGLLRLESRDWSVAAARADRLPTLTLGGSVSASDGDIGHVIDQWAGNLVAGLAAPLIDGGRRRAEVDYQKALAEEAVANYRSVVLNAVTEVNDALLTERKTAARRDMQQKQYEALSDQLDEAQLRYRRGLNDYLAVLNAVAAKQALERNLINSGLEVYTARIDLYRALGGDWMDAASNRLSE